MLFSTCNGVLIDLKGYFQDPKGPIWTFVIYLGQYLRNGASVAIAHLGWDTSDIGLGQWVNIVHETVCRQWFGVV